MEGERAYKEQLRELVLFGLEKREIQLLFSAAKWGLGDGARLFFVVCSQRTRGTFCSRGKSYKAQGEKGKKCVPSENSQDLEILSRISILGDVQDPAQPVSQVSPALIRGLDLDLQRSLPT